MDQKFLIPALLILILVSAGCISGKDGGPQNNNSKNNISLNSFFLKEEYEEGKGYLETEEDEHQEKETKEWVKGKYKFRLTISSYNPQERGNIGSHSHILEFNSSSLEPLNVKKFPVLGCDNISLPIPDLNDEFTIKRDGNHTKISIHETLTPGPTVEENMTRMLAFIVPGGNCSEEHLTDRWSKVDSCFDNKINKCRFEDANVWNPVNSSVDNTSCVEILRNNRSFSCGS